LERGREVALSAPASAESASNPPFLKLADSRRKKRKKKRKNWVSWKETLLTTVRLKNF